MIKAHRPVAWRECLFLVIALFFFLGCIATSHRSGKTLRPGQASFSVSYLQAENLEESGTEPVRLFAADARFGVARGFDLGLMHTWDLTQDNENAFATGWFDLKGQLTNLENDMGQPIFTIGIRKGYVYDDEIDTHITCLPLTLSVPVSSRVTPFFTYRHEIFSEGFLPSELEGPRRSFILGCEIDASRDARDRWSPLLGFNIGTFNGLAGGDEEDRGLTLNVGVGVTSPGR